MGLLHISNMKAMRGVLAMAMYSPIARIADIQIRKLSVVAPKLLSLSCSIPQVIRYLSVNRVLKFNIHIGTIQADHFAPTASSACHCAVCTLTSASHAAL